MVGVAHRPAASIIIPAFNAAEHLPAALDSLLAQTMQDFEVIVVDDISEDGTWECIERYKRKDGRIGGIRTERKAWASGARNLGIQQAKGRHIAFLDADDISLPARLERQVNYLDANPNVSACGTWARMFGSDNRVMCVKTRSNDVGARLAFSAELIMPSMCVRRDIFRCGMFFDETLSYNEDWEWMVRVAQAGRVANLGEVLINYRRWPGQASARITDTVDCVATAIRSDYLDWIGIPKAEQDLVAHIWCAPALWPVTVETPGEAVTNTRISDWLQRLRPVFRSKFGESTERQLADDCLQTWRQRALDQARCP